MAIQRINLGTAPSGTGGDTNRSAFTKIDGNFADSTNAASRLVGTATGNVMEVGAFGIGGNLQTTDTQSATDAKSFLNILGDKTRLTYAVSNVFAGKPFGMYAMGLLMRSGSDMAFFGISQDTFEIGATLINGQNQTSNIRVRTDKNTQVDPNGFIKNASPIVSLYADKIELNDEAAQQEIVFEKLGIGDYLIKGSLGFAQEGWYIEMPKDANGNVLVAVVYEQLANNDIGVKTYDYMLNKKGRIVPDLETPLDIPATRWIDLRLQALPQSDIAPTDNTVNTNAE